MDYVRYVSGELTSSTDSSVNLSPVHKLVKRLAEVKKPFE